MMLLMVVFFLLGGLATVECKIDFESQSGKKTGDSTNYTESRAVRDCIWFFVGLL